jgi:hypothetical protein
MENIIFIFLEPETVCKPQKQFPKNYETRKLFQWQNREHIV